MTLSKPTPLTGNVTVQASAGSGKTYLLVSRLIHLLLSGVKPDAILAITFTRKAAAEMQDRLLKRIYDLATAEPGELKTMLQEIDLDGDDPTIVHRARQLYEFLLYNPHPVHTTTFHAFCQDLLRRFPLEADVPPGFELMEQTGALLDQAWEALMVNAARQPENTTAQSLAFLFMDIGLTNTRTALNNFLQQRSDWWAYTQDETDPIHYAKQCLLHQLGIKESEDPLVSFFNAPEVQQKLQDFARLLDKHPIKNNVAHVDDINEAIDPSFDINARFNKLWPVFFTGKNEPRKRKESEVQRNKMGDTGQQQFLALHDELCKQLINIRDNLNAQHTLALNTAWYIAGSKYLEHYQQIKLEQRLLDFTDLEWKTYQLLNRGDNTLWVQYKLDSRIEHLLIDEFQDTNPTQWHLVKPLLEEMAGSHINEGRSVFLVGDAKQSIYRFRRAEPRLFENAAVWLQQHLDATTFPLNKSWRSAPAVIKFVNQVFGEGPLHQRLSHFEPHEVEYRDRWGLVTLLPLTHEPEHEHDEILMRHPLLAPRAENYIQRFALEARQITETITQLINQPVSIHAEEGPRPVEYRDIIILLRNRTHIADFEHELRAAGIPYLGADRGTLLDCLEVQDMVNLLQWLNRPHDNLALAGILRSPLFAASDDDLMQLAQSAGNSPWLDRLSGLVNDLAPDEPLVRANHFLNQWRILAGHIPVHDLLDQIYSQGNVQERFAAAFPDHQRPRVIANLTRFLELALEMDSGRYPSLMRFITWLQELRQQQNDAPDEPVSSGDSNRVRLLTIHSAKGLEAPVVFLADATNQSPNRGAYSVMLNWPVETSCPDTLLLAPRMDQQDTLTRQLLMQQQQDEMREETNLLYVALTRSRQLLYISGSMPTRGKQLGWYGEIANRYALDPVSISLPQVLEEQGAPSTPRPRSAQTTKKSYEVDPRLRNPLDLSPAYYEIAPSRHLSHSTATGEVGDEDGRMRGIYIHALLDQLTRSIDASIVTEALHPDLNVSETDAATWLEEAHNLIALPELQFLFNPIHYHQAMNEVPLIYQSNGITVHGVIDRLVVNENEVLIIDYKTHQHACLENITTLAEPYWKQLVYYAEGVRQIWPTRKIRTLLLFTACARIVEQTT